MQNKSTVNIKWKKNNNNKMNAGDIIKKTQCVLVCFPPNIYESIKAWNSFQKRKQDKLIDVAEMFGKIIIRVGEQKQSLENLKALTHLCCASADIGHHSRRPVFDDICMMEYFGRF